MKNTTTRGQCVWKYCSLARERFELNWFELRFELNNILWNVLIIKYKFKCFRSSAVLIRICLFGGKVLRENGAS